MRPPNERDRSRSRSAGRRHDDRRLRDETPERRRTADRDSEELCGANRRSEERHGAERRSEKPRRRSNSPRDPRRRRSPSTSSQRPSVALQNSTSSAGFGRDLPHWLPATVKLCHDEINKIRNNLKLTDKDVKNKVALLAEKEKLLTEMDKTFEKLLAEKDKTLEKLLAEKDKLIKDEEERITELRHIIDSLTNSGVSSWNIPRSRGGYGGPFPN
ncbi:hypothetical protein QAD02_011692 [Eretmocerus hayati]|uniref:Uncharacterized protein n=1 Tax=Eretmocerus hayati TaxID=131215 RepID=A0ACC2NXN2_9HYME|nr:hypothetical protein QAD02_011692 [Eretmocerus hayati]